MLLFVKEFFIFFLSFHFFIFSPPQIRIKELIYQAWSKNQVNQAPNVLASIQLFNRLSHWVAAEIVCEPNDVPRRFAVVVMIRIAVLLLFVLHEKKQNKKIFLSSSCLLEPPLTLLPTGNNHRIILQGFIKLAWNLRALQNYNSLFAIVCGLELGCVSRLKNTWKAAFSSSRCETRFRTLVSVCASLFFSFFLVLCFLFLSFPFSLLCVLGVQPRSELPEISCLVKVLFRFSLLSFSFFFFFFFFFFFQFPTRTFPILSFSFPPPLFQHKDHTKSEQKPNLLFLTWVFFCAI